MRYDDMGQPVKPEQPHENDGSSHWVWYGEALAEWESVYPPAKEETVKRTTDSE